MIRILVAFCLAICLGLAGCGKRGDPRPPEDTELTFPREYPTY